MPNNETPKPPQDSTPELLDWITHLPCLICELRPGTTPKQIVVSQGYDGAALSDPHHVVSKGAGGGDLNNVVPLCRMHHDEGGRIGWPSFRRKYRINLIRHAHRLTAEWRVEKAALDALPFREESVHARPKPRRRVR